MADLTIKQAAEQVASGTTPVPIGVSGATLIGITVQDWVLIATALLVTLQLVVITPKAISTVKSFFRKEPPNGCT